MKLLRVFPTWSTARTLQVRAFFFGGGVTTGGSILGSSISGISGIAGGLGCVSLPSVFFWFRPPQISLMTDF